MTVSELLLVLKSSKYKKPKVTSDFEEASMWLYTIKAHNQQVAKNKLLFLVYMEKLFDDSSVLVVDTEYLA